MSKKAVMAGMIAGLLLAAGGARASGLKIDNVSVKTRDAKTATVTFDITWSNAWQHGSFHDAAWVFFKARPNAPSTGLGAGAAPWQHVRLVADRVVNPAGFVPGEGTPIEIVVSEDRVGMFIRLAADGNGTVSAKGVTVSVEPTTDNRPPTTEIRAFGIEMAYIAEGPFSLGSYGREWNRFFKWTGDGLETPPYRVTGSGPIPTGRREGALWAVALQPEDGGEIPTTFPNGYAAFYCTKLPFINLGQYADFLNTLTPALVGKRYQEGGHGRWIRREGKPDAAVFTPSKPAEYLQWLSWADGAAYAAWAGLRPMTDLEYEKMVRGPQEPAGGFDAGYSFWGCEVVNQGEILERCVGIFSAAGRAFTGTHGAGTPEPPADWPLDFNDVAFRCDAPDPWGAHLTTAGRNNGCGVGYDRSSSDLNAWRAARTAPVPGQDALQGKPAGDTAMRPVVPRTFVVNVPRLESTVRLDAVPAGWGAPLATLGLEDVFPVECRFVPQNNRPPWGGAGDLSARIFLGRDDEALLVGAEVTDDKQMNKESAGNIWNGDVMQVGVVTARGHWNLGLALTTNGVVFHQFEGPGDGLVKAAACAVTRDEKARITRYGLRLPLAALKLKPGEEFGFNVMSFDDDDGQGQRLRMEMAPGITYPFRPEKYPRFILGR